MEYPYHIIAFFRPLGSALGVRKQIFGVRMVQLRIRADSAFVMNCPDRFYADVRKDIFLAKKAVKRFFIYLSRGE